MTLKPGDLVRTPSGRMAVIDRLRQDGRRDLIYIEDGEPVALSERLLVRVREAPVTPWRKHTLR